MSEHCQNNASREHLWCFPALNRKPKHDFDLMPSKINARLPASFKHGFNRDNAQHPFYRCWANMIQRCTNPNHTHWQRYGGRGITVCEEWMDFLRFRDDMLSTWVYGLKLERLDNERGYSKANCVWKTQKEQCRNTGSNHTFTLNGETLCLQDWAARLDVSYVCILNRLRRGWPEERALTTESQRRK